MTAIETTETPATEETPAAPAITTAEFSAVFADAKVLRAAMKNAALFCSKDDLRPILAGASFEFEPGKVRVIATDSYRLLVQEVPAEVTGAGSVIVSRSDLVMLASMKTPAAPAYANKAPGILRIDHSGEVSATIAGVSVTAGRVVFGDFPNWRNLVPNIADDVAGAAANFNPAFLGDFAKLEPLTGETRAKWSGTVRVILDPSPLKPAKFEMTRQEGAEVFGLLMPVRAN